MFLTAYVAPDWIHICVDSGTGKVRWREALALEKVERGSGLGSPAAPTAVTDGRRVVFYSGPFGLLARDYSGKELWRCPLPPPVTQHGVGSSPVVASGKVFLLRDQDLDSELIALDLEDGRILWRAPRPDFRRGFATPMVLGDGSDGQILVSGTLRAVAYRQGDGQEAWSVSGLPNELCPTPVTGAGLVFITGWTSGSGVSRMPEFSALLAAGDLDKDGRLSREEAPAGPARHHFPYIDADKDGYLTREEYESIASIFGRSQNALMAVRPGGVGDVTGTNVVWKFTRGLPYVPSPVYYRDRLFMVKNGGLATCLNATNGVASYQEERLGVVGDFYASPVAGNGRVLMISQPGVAVVLAASDQLEVLGTNPLGSTVLATPALVGGRLLIRTATHLLAFAESGTKPEAGASSK